MFRALLRFPGGTIQTQALTGDPHLDAFLVELDAHLLGSARVRWQPCAEIQDHLRAKQTDFVRSGCDADEAARRAMLAMGEPREQADAFNQTLVRKFRRIAVQSGAVFAVLMGLLMLARPMLRVGLAGSALFVLFEALLFGLFLGWCMAYVWPQHALASRAADGANGSRFIVSYPAWLRFLGYVGLILFASLALLFVARGAAGILLDASISERIPFTLSYSPRILLVLGGLGLIDAYLMRLCCRTYRVDEQGILIKEPFGRKTLACCCIRI
jgi:hypothetical protein